MTIRDECKTSTYVGGRDFREGMARVAAAVNIVTSADGNEWYGFTASAITSVTDSPPTLLVCVNKHAQTSSVIQKTRLLCVNTVTDEHKELTMTFAGAGGVKDMTVRFAGAQWSHLVTGAPVLENAVVSFDCRVVRSLEIGTHYVFFCEVAAMQKSENIEGLVYFDRKFLRVA